MRLAEAPQRIASPEHDLRSLCWEANLPASRGVMKNLALLFFALALSGCPSVPSEEAAKSPAPAAAPAGNWTELGEGLRYEELVLGTGPLVKPGDTVLTHASGTFTDGKSFWSSLDEGKKIAFPLREESVIAGWARGVPGMKVGGRRKLYIPWALAYGEAGRPPTIPAKADLVFVIEVFEIQ